MVWESRPVAILRSGWSWSCLLPPIIIFWCGHLPPLIYLCGLSSRSWLCFQQLLSWFKRCLEWTHGFTRLHTMHQTICDRPWCTSFLHKKKLLDGSLLSIIQPRSPFTEGRKKTCHKSMGAETCRHQHISLQQVFMQFLEQNGRT